MGGLTHGIAIGADLVTAFKQGLAGGMASCLNLAGTDFTFDDYSSFLTQISISSETLKI